jgi:hypothetical protein
VGWRRWLQSCLVWAADWVPGIAFLAACIMLLWRYFLTDYPIQLLDFLKPVLVLLFVLIVLHLTMLLLLPMRWPTIRGDFQRRLARRIREELDQVYGGIPAEIALAVAQERGEIDRLASEARRMADWLAEQEQAISVKSLYGR